MKKQLTHLVCGLTFACALMGTLSSCDPKLDYDNIDPSAKVDMGLAIPVGELELTLGDFIGDSTIDGISIIGDSIYQFEYSLDTLNKEFHEINLPNYKSSVKRHLVIKDNLPEGWRETLPSDVQATLPLDQYGLVGGVDYVLTFPLVVDLNINKDLGNERVDSLCVLQADFSSIFTVKDLNIQFGDIKKLEIEMPAQNFRRAAGNRLEIPLSGYNFGDSIPILVDNFTINLIEDPTKAPGADNVLNQVTFNLIFTVNITSSPYVLFTETAEFGYKFDINFLDFSSIYGYFSESNKMHEKDTIDIAKELGDFWTNLKNLKLPVAEPELQLDLIHSVAAPLLGHINELTAWEESTGKKVQATFKDASGNVATEYTKEFNPYLTIDSPLDATITNTLVFNKDTGALDQLFDVRPDKIFYNFFFSLRSVDGVNQHRLTPHTKVGVVPTIRLPFSLHRGLEFNYSDTTDLNIPSLDVNDFMAEVDQVDSITINDVKLVLTAMSSLPINVKGKVYFLDENGQDVGIRLNEDNTVVINGAEQYFDINNATPSKSVIIADANSEDVEKLKRAKQLYFELQLSDISDRSSDVIKLSPKAGLKVKVALAADVNAYLKLAFND